MDYEIETYRLSKPYPLIKLGRDGKDLVFSFLSFYMRIKDVRRRKQ